MKHLQTAGIAATLLSVAVLATSMLTGMRTAAGSESHTVDFEPPADRIRVEVLNAAGVPGLARAVTRTLREHGFDVVYFGNAPAGVQDSSVVLDRVGSEDGARRVAKTLGISRVADRPDSTLYLETTVILGQDWNETEGLEEPE